FPPTRPSRAGDMDDAPATRVTMTSGTTSICNNRRNRSPKGCSTAMGGPMTKPAISPATSAMPNFQIRGNARYRRHHVLGFSCCMAIPQTCGCSHRDLPRSAASVDDERGALVLRIQVGGAGQLVVGVGVVVVDLTGGQLIDHSVQARHGRPGAPFTPFVAEVLRLSPTLVSSG